MSYHNDPTPKIGAGHFRAMGRQGLKELQAAVYTNSNVAQPAEQGTFGTATPGEVQNQRGKDVMGNDPSQNSVIGERLRQAEMRHDASDDRARDRDE